MRGFPDPDEPFCGTLGLDRGEGGKGEVGEGDNLGGEELTAARFSGGGCRIWRVARMGFMVDDGGWSQEPSSQSSDGRLLRLSFSLLVVKGF